MSMVLWRGPAEVARVLAFERSVQLLVACLLVGIIVMAVSAMRSARDGDRAAPTVPRDVRVVRDASAAVTVVWEAAIDDTGIDRYELVAGATGVAATIAGTDTSVPVAPGRSYRIRAIDRAGRASAWTVVTA